MYDDIIIIELKKEEKEIILWVEDLNYFLLGY